VRDQIRPSRAASRRALCASRAELGREPAKHATVSAATPALARRCWG
jgi:hypothetical protein